MHLPVLLLRVLYSPLLQLLHRLRLMVVILMAICSHLHFMNDYPSVAIQAPSGLCRKREERGREKSIQPPHYHSPTPPSNGPSHPSASSASPPCVSRSAPHYRHSLQNQKSQPFPFRLHEYHSTLSLIDLYFSPYHIINAAPPDSPRSLSFEYLVAKAANALLDGAIAMARVVGRGRAAAVAVAANRDVLRNRTDIISLVSILLLSFKCLVFFCFRYGLPFFVSWFNPPHVRKGAS